MLKNYALPSSKSNVVKLKFKESQSNVVQLRNIRIHGMNSLVQRNSS